MRTTISFALFLMWVGCDEPVSTDAAVEDAGFDAGGSGTAPCPADAGPLDAPSSSGLTNACTEGLLLSGFGLRWDDGSHLMGDWGVYPRVDPDQFPDGCFGPAALRGATLVTELNGRGPPVAEGDPPPAGRVRATYSVIGADVGFGPDAGASFRGIRIIRGNSVVDIGPADAGEGTTPAIFNVGLAGLTDAPAITVVLEGIELRTDLTQVPEYPGEVDPAEGYPVRGIGASIENVSLAGDDLTFDVGAHFSLGLAGELPLDNAVALARVQVVVHYAIVALSVAPTLGSLQYREDHIGHGTAERAVCRPEAAVTELRIDAPPRERAAPALTRFQIDVFGDDAPLGDGLRELAVRILDFEYDAGTGSATMRVEGYASNGGPPAPRRPMHYEISADVALLQWEGTERVEPQRFEAPVTAGHTEQDLPLTVR